MVKLENNILKKKINSYNFKKQLLIIIVSINILLNSFFSAKFSVLTSDIVWGNLLLPEIFRSKIYLAFDTYLLHYPFTFLIYLLWGLEHTAVFINIFLLVLLTLVAYSIFYVYFVNRYLNKHKLVYYLPLVFFINISWAFYYNIAQAFSRNIEFGVVFLILIYFDNLKSAYHKRFLTVLVYITMLLLLISDPYFIYLFAIPLLLVLLTKTQQGRIYTISAVRVILTLIAFVCAYIFLNLTPYFVIYIVNPGLSSFNGIVSNFSLLTQGVIILLNAQLTSNIFSIVSLVFFLVGIFGLFLLLKEGYKKVDTVIPILLPICFCFTILAYLISNFTSRDIGTIRYLVFLFFILPFGISFFISKTKSLIFRNFLVSALLILTIANFIAIYSNFHKLNNSQPYQQNYKILEAINKYHYAYGYTSYWNAAVNTYISDNRIKHRQVICIRHHIYPYYWLSAHGWYEMNKEITKNFILIDFNGNLTPELNGCNLKDITRQFGKPDKIVPLVTKKGTFSLILFGHNIAGEL